MDFYFMFIVNVENNVYGDKPEISWKATYTHILTDDLFSKTYDS